MKANFCPNCGSTNILYGPHPLLSQQNLCLSCGVMFELIQKKVEVWSLAHKVIQKFRNTYPLKVVVP